MTLPAPSLNEMVPASNCLPFFASLPVYLTLTMSPGAAAGPLPGWMSVTSRPSRRICTAWCQIRQRMPINSGGGGHVDGQLYEQCFRDAKPGQGGARKTVDREVTGESLPHLRDGLMVQRL
jgi:hypothetical protein